MKRVGGFRRKSRHKLKRSVKEKGKLPIQRFLQKFETGEKVVLKAYPSYHRGFFSLRFWGKAGEIVKMQGKCYQVKIRDGKKEKICVVHPVHLIRA